MFLGRVSERVRMRVTDRRTVVIEDLPPLELSSLRGLDFDEDPGHIASASGSSAVGHLVYVIGDDMLDLGVFRHSRPEPGRLVSVLHEDDREDKPDLEAPTVPPPFEAHPYGTVPAVGSGSEPGSDRGAVWALAPDGSLRAEPQSGEPEGVPLTFRDATPAGRETLVFTASADGDEGIRASVVGTIDLDGEVRRLRTIDRRHKVEGVHASVDTGVVDILFVCDQDVPDESSSLLSAAMPLDAAHEWR